MIEVKIPKTIKVGGLDYKIEVGGDKLDLIASNCLGEHYFVKQLITIQDGLPPQQFMLTFLHETMHAINDAYLSDKLCENDVNGIVNGILQVLEQLGIRFVE